MTTGDTLHEVELSIGGMTCASCAARIEKKLNKMPGVSASVNYATEKARVHFSAGVAPEDLVATVEATGYTAALPAPPSQDQPAEDAGQRAKDEEAAAWRQRLLVSAVLTVPVLLMSMVPALQFDNWQWLSLTLASPVVVWGALPFHRAACAAVQPRWSRSGEVTLKRPSAGMSARNSSHAASASGISAPIATIAASAPSVGSRSQ